VELPPKRVAPLLDKAAIMAHSFDEWKDPLPYDVWLEELVRRFGDLPFMLVEYSVSETVSCHTNNGANALGGWAVNSDGRHSWIRKRDWFDKTYPFSRKVGY
jgi:hypothetical protein